MITRAEKRQEIVCVLLATLFGCITMALLSHVGVIDSSKEPDIAVVTVGIPTVLVYALLRFMLALRPRWFN